MSQSDRVEGDQKKKIESLSMPEIRQRLKNNMHNDSQARSASSRSKEEDGKDDPKGLKVAG